MDEQYYVGLYKKMIRLRAEDFKIRHELDQISKELDSLHFTDACNFKAQAERELKGEKIIVIDVETTGLEPEEDEILQLSIINGNKEVLMNSYFKPEHHERWEKASSINQIYPEDVKDKQPISDYIDEIQKYFDRADLVIGYNVEFDLEFLNNKGIKYDGKIYDAMYEYADLVQTQWIDTEHYTGWKVCKLTDACRVIGYKFKENKAHDSLGDVLATLAVYDWVEDKRATKIKRGERTK